MTLRVVFSPGAIFKLFESASGGQDPPSCVMKSGSACCWFLVMTVAVSAAERGWKLNARHDAVARLDGQGAVHLETQSEEGTARVSRELQVPDDTQEVHVQVDWRPHDNYKAAGIFTLTSFDANHALVKILTVPGRNRLSYSTGDNRSATTTAPYRVGHWHRIHVRVSRGAYHLAVIDRGPENLRGVRVVFDSQRDLKTPPSLMNHERPLRKFVATAFPNQGKQGYSFELANFKYSLK